MIEPDPAHHLALTEPLFSNVRRTPGRSPDTQRGTELRHFFVRSRLDANEDGSVERRGVERQIELPDQDSRAITPGLESPLGAREESAAGTLGPKHDIGRRADPVPENLHPSRQPERRLQDLTDPEPTMTTTRTKEGGAIVNEQVRRGRQSSPAVQGSERSTESSAQEHPTARSIHSIAGHDPRTILSSTRIPPTRTLACQSASRAATKGVRQADLEARHQPRARMAQSAGAAGQR